MTIYHGGGGLGGVGDGGGEVVQVERLHLALVLLHLPLPRRLVRRYPLLDRHGLEPWSSRREGLVSFLGDEEASGEAGRKGLEAREGRGFQGRKSTVGDPTGENASQNGKLSRRKQLPPCFSRHCQDNTKYGLGWAEPGC